MKMNPHVAFEDTITFSFGNYGTRQPSRRFQRQILPARWEGPRLRGPFPAKTKFTDGEVAVPFAPHGLMRGQALQIALAL